MAGEAEVQRALDLINEENYGEALVLLDQACSLTGVLEEKCIILLNKAKCFESLGKINEARRCLERIKKVDVSHFFEIYVAVSEIHILYKEGKLKYKEGKLKEAIEESDLLLTKYKNLFATQEYQEIAYDLRLRVACELVTLGDYSKAIGRLQEFLVEAQEEDRARIYLFLGVARKQLNDLQGAIDEFKRAVSSGGPEDILADAHYRLGILYLQAGAPAWAKQHFQVVESMETDETNVPLRDLYIVLANASAHLGQEEERQHYLQLMRATPEKR